MIDLLNLFFGGDSEGYFEEKEKPKVRQIKDGKWVPWL